MPRLSPVAAGGRLQPPAAGAGHRLMGGMHKTAAIADRADAGSLDPVGCG
jgi:hypothetical protein